MQKRYNLSFGVAPRPNIAGRTGRKTASVLAAMAEQTGDDTRRTRIHLDGSTSNSIVAALSHEVSRRILVSTVLKARTVQDISSEQAIPLSTCYRVSNELLAQGLLVVERVFVTEGGKRYCVYRSAFKTIEIISNFHGVYISAELNDDVLEKVRFR